MITVAAIRYGKQAYHWENKGWMQCFVLFIFVSLFGDISVHCKPVFLLIILLIFFCLAIYIPLTFGLCIFGFYVYVFNARKYCFFFWCSYCCRAVRLLKCIIHCFLLTGRRYSRFMCTYGSGHSFMLPALAVAFGTPCVCSIYGKSMDFKPKRELKY